MITDHNSEVARVLDQIEGLLPQAPADWHATSFVPADGRRTTVIARPGECVAAMCAGFEDRAALLALLHNHAHTLVALGRLALEAYYGRALPAEAGRCRACGAEALRVTQVQAGRGRGAVTSRCDACGGELTELLAAEGCGGPAPGPLAG